MKRDGVSSAGSLSPRAPSVLHESPRGSHSLPDYRVYIYVFFLFVMGAPKRKCSKCGQKHAKPTGAKCGRLSSGVEPKYNGEQEMAPFPTEDGMEGRTEDLTSSEEAESWQDGVQSVRDEVREGLSTVDMRLTGIERAVAAIAASVGGNGGNRPREENYSGKGADRSSSRESRGHRRHRHHSSRRPSSTDSSQDRKRQPTSREKRSSRKFELTRHLPRDERDKSFTFENLVFCNVALAYECYRRGEDIGGLLQHIMFLSEKAHSRIYTTVGLVRYDEAVREKAKERGLVAYTAADAILTSRFLGAEYTRELSKRKYGQNRAGGRASTKVKLACHGSS